MQKKHQHSNTGLSRFGLLGLIIFVWGSLYIQTVSAQSKCAEDGDGFLACDLSITLLEEQPTSKPDKFYEWPWRPTHDERTALDEQLKLFANDWCEATLGKSRINKISIFTDYRKSSADVALYKDVGRSYSYVGTFTKLHPSMVLYYNGFYDKSTIDRYLGKVLVHEFSHAAFKIYDEYIEYGARSADICIRPLESDNPRRTVMNDHRIYTRYSHPEDYADSPPAQTAQYRCYSKSAWEVLMQPEHCDSTLSLQVNAWFARKDYFATGSSCSSIRVPPLNMLENPKSSTKVMDCINKTSDELQIDLLSGQENAIFAIAPDIDALSKVKVQQEVHKMLNLMAQDVDVEVALTNYLADDPQTTVQTTDKKKIAMLNLNSNDVSTLVDAKQNVESLGQELNRMFTSNPRTQRSIDQSLNAAMTIFSNEAGAIANDHNVVIMISDTTTMPSASVLSTMKEHNIAVHTIGIGSEANPGLKKLATETGGKYFTVAPKDSSELLHYAIKSNLPVANNHDTHDELVRFTLQDSSTRTSVWIPEGIQYAYFDIYLTDPGSELSEFIVTPPQEESFDEPAAYHTATDHSYLYLRPMPGLWEVIISGDGGFQYRFTTISLVDVDVSAGTEVLPGTSEDAAVTYPQPFTMKVRSHGRMPLLNANVTAEVITPLRNPNPVKLKLSDDGVSPDLIKGDGVYSAALKNYAAYGDGIYTIKATVNNADGNAMFDDVGVATFGDMQLEAPRAAPSFQHISYYQVEVTGTKAKILNTDSKHALAIKTDGMLNWGTIEEEGQTNWYSFTTTTKNKTYYIHTSNLLSHGDTEMATRMSLYEPASGEAEPQSIVSNAGYMGTNVSHIERRLGKNKSYLVSVSHANNGEGVYGLTISSHDMLLSDYEVNPPVYASTSTSVSGGGGGYADHLLLVILLTALVVLYSRRKEHRYFN